MHSAQRADLGSGSWSRSCLAARTSHSLPKPREMEGGAHALLTPTITLLAVLF